MPIYEFKCQVCGKVSEFLLSGPLDNKTSGCPECGSHHLVRLISAPVLLRTQTNAPGTTCCGRTERCETPPCSTGQRCHRH